VSYVIAAGLVLGVLHLMSKLRSSLPEAMLITDYVNLGLGVSLGNLTRRVYWSFWTLLVAIEAIAGANIISPVIGLQALPTAAILLVTSTLLGERISRFMESVEIPLSTIKVIMLIAFIVLLLIRLRGTPFALPWTHHDPVTAHDGIAVIAGVSVATFSLAGMEIIHAVSQATAARASIWEHPMLLVGIRVFGFHVVSIALILSVIDTSAVQPGISPIYDKPGFGQL
jgi:L-asparagine transporter-like permease